MQLTSLIPLSSLLLLAEASSKPHRTSEIYYLTNCFDTATSTITSWAEIDYYKNSSKSAISGDAAKPDLKDIISPTSDLDYEDGTWNTLPGSPFTFTAFIGDDAYTAKEGTVVGNANASTYAGTLKCERLTRVVVYEPKKDTDCYADYACVDP